MLTANFRFSLKSVPLLKKSIQVSLPYSATLTHMSHQQNLIPPTEDGITFGAKLINEGKLVAFPTETVYGLGANALDKQACTSIFVAKGRPMTDPLIVHVSEPSQAASLTAIDGSTLDMFNQLAAEFWPGPLTIIVKAADCIPPEVTANTGFVGIRCPNHPLALTFLSTCNLPVAAPSANLFGHVSPTLAQHVLDDLGSKGVRVLDGDSVHSSHTCLHGIESTVVKLGDASDGNKKQIMILRQGAISQAQLERIAGSKVTEEAWSVVALQRQVLMESPKATTAPATDTDNNAAKLSASSTAPTLQGIEQSQGEVAPGQALTHYAPYIPCYAVASCRSNSSVLHNFNNEESSQSLKITAALERYNNRTLNISMDDLKSVVILDFLGQLVEYSPHCLAYRDLSSTGDASDAARKLFASLRWAELQENANQVYVAPIISPPGASFEECDGNGGGVAVSESKYDLFLGLSDRIFRATSGASISIVME